MQDICSDEARCAPYTGRVMQRADIAVVGAGAAGLMAAIWAGRCARRRPGSAAIRIVVIDGARTLGAKILVAGGGLFQTRESFFADSVTSREGAFTAGGGVRAIVGDRVLVGLDARVGWELHLRLTGTIGLQIGR